MPAGWIADFILFLLHFITFECKQVLQCDTFCYDNDDDEEDDDDNENDDDDEMLNFFYWA